jgi:hypothetical protein
VGIATRGAWCTGLLPRATLKAVVIKAVWLGVAAGADKALDSAFHYPQEIDKLRAGLYTCTAADVISLAALQLVADGASVLLLSCPLSAYH